MIEIEKKYKVTREQFVSLHSFCSNAVGVMFQGTELEINTLYKGNSLSENEVLRVRKIVDDFKPKYVVTYKGKANITDTGVKSRTEIEFETTSSEIETFITSLKFLPTLTYEKNRWTWHKDTGIIGEPFAICLDELPFGYYVELEGDVAQIEHFEQQLKDKLDMILDVEMYSYPDLTKIYGKSVNAVTEARFS